MIQLHGILKGSQDAGEDHLSGPSKLIVIDFDGVPKIFYVKGVNCKSVELIEKSPEKDIWVWVDDHQKLLKSRMFVPKIERVLILDPASK